MDPFHYHHNELWAEDVPLANIAKQFGTPCYVYSQATLRYHYRAYLEAFANYPHLICYAVKANSNIALLNLLARWGGGFDIVSQGELERVLAARGNPGKIVYSGVGKSTEEMARALTVGIRCFNIESSEELLALEATARTLQQKAPIAIRINPDIDPGTHPYIATGLSEHKFGVDRETALGMYDYASRSAHLDIVGVACHIGSQLTQISPFVLALQALVDVADVLRNQGITIKHLDLGGGLGIRYQQEVPPLPSDLSLALGPLLAARPYELHLEPGRSLAASSGLLLTRVRYRKTTPRKHFAIIDAAMTDLIRPALYTAWHEIVPVKIRDDEPMQDYDIVGPVCESSDFLGKGRALSIHSGDLLAVRNAGAYGFVMSSQYNSRPRACEVMVDGEKIHLIRERESMESLFALEKMLPL